MIRKIDKSNFTYKACTDEIIVEDCYKFLNLLGKGEIFYNKDENTLVYLMSDGVFFAYDCFVDKNKQNLYYTKRAGFEGTYTAHKRFIKTVKKHGQCYGVHEHKVILRPVTNVYEDVNNKIACDTYDFSNSKDFIMTD